MLVIYWDCRKILRELDLIRLFLTRERPDLLILSNAWDYVSKGVTNPSSVWGQDQDGNPYKEFSYSRTERHSYAVLAIAREGVLKDYIYMPSEKPVGDSYDANRIATFYTTDGFDIAVVCAPSYPQKSIKRQRRIVFNQRLLDCAAAAAITNAVPPPQPVLFIGNFQVAHTELDIHPFMVTPTQRLVSPTLRANFQSILNLGYYDMFRAFNPSGGYYNAFRRSRNDVYENKNLGARTTYALASRVIRERITRCWHPNFNLSHYHPIAVYILPTDSSKGNASPIKLTHSEPFVSPTNTVRSGDNFSLDIEINLNFPPYLPYAPTYQWFKDGTEVSDNDPRFQDPFTRGYDYSVFIVFNAQPSDSGSYRVRVQNTFHTVWSDPVDVVVLDELDESNPNYEMFFGPYQNSEADNPYFFDE